MFKKFTVIFFMSYISIFLIISIIKPDMKINEIENKILTQFIMPDAENIKNGKFMSNFENYVSEQFPFRNTFIYIKNTFNYLLGNREFRNIYVTENRLLEKFKLNKHILGKNIDSINNITYSTNIPTDILIIPTSIAFYNDELPNYAISDNQNNVLNDISCELIGNFYNPYSVLDNHKDEYIYFKTDHHWTQLGARYVYEDMYKKNISSEYSKVADDFKGSYYSKALLPNMKGDEIFAYKEFNNFNITFDFDNSSSTLYDEKKLNTKNKYQYFLNGDPGYGIIEGSGVDEILIFKDSFAHNFIPFLAKDYSKIHIVDPRYYALNVLEYIEKNPKINKILFIHNINTLNTDDVYKKVIF